MKKKWQSKKMKSRFKSAFSITELSIVMLIIGFLIASTFAYQAMTKQAHRRYIINEFKYYDSAINNFRTKYKYLPGDYPYLVGANTPMDNMNPVFTNYAVLPYGNGNNQWDTYNNGTYTVTEYIAGWAHLSAAKFIEANYNYTNSSTVTSYGTSVPPFMYNVSIAMIPYSTHYNTTANFLSTCVYGCGLGISTPDAFYVDQKIDDGIPGLGQVLTNRLNPGQWTCVGSETTSALYNMTDGYSTTNCVTYFVISGEDY